MRIVETGVEDAICGHAINRIRHYYLELAGDDARYFTLSGNDDSQGVLGNAGMNFSPALDASEFAFAHGTYLVRPGNTLDVLVDGSEMLPAVAQELSRAQSYVHIAGWFFSPELQRSREDEPVIVRNLLAELAERINVRVSPRSWRPRGQAFQHKIRRKTRAPR